MGASFATSTKYDFVLRPIQPNTHCRASEGTASHLNSTQRQQRFSKSTFRQLRGINNLGSYAFQLRERRGQEEFSIMEITSWDERYRSGRRAAEDLNAPPTPLLVHTVSNLALKRPSAPANAPLRALDLACGTGRNALWLAEHGWTVTAVDAAPSAIAILKDRATQRSLTIDTRVADLTRSEFPIAPAAWDLIAMCYYLQRDLFEPAKQGIAPGGLLLAIVHVTEPGEEPTAHRLCPGELAGYLAGWEIIHYYEGKPDDPAHQRSVAEIVARRPLE